MENTNKDILKEQYENIPKCINKVEHEEIVSALCEILKERNSNNVDDEISEAEKIILSEWAF